MSTTVTPLGLRLFLEGIEVPVISAQVTLTPDQPAVAAIQIVPSEMAMHMLPRTLVHLFYLDDEQLPDLSLNKPRDGAVTDDLNRFEAPDAQYKLMFCGEVIGFNYGKTADARQLVLQCMDLSSYWDTCYQWYADWSVGGNALTDKMHVFVGAGKTEFNSVSGGHQWVIGELLQGKPRSPGYQKTKGLLRGLIHLLEAIGGLRYTKGGDPGVHGVNDFFTIAELRYNLLGMIGAIEEDDTSTKLYNAKAFTHWLRNGMTSMGNLLSFRDIINHVCRYIFHHVYPNPCAFYKEGNLGTRDMTIDAPLFNDTPEGLLVYNYVKIAVNSLGQAASNVVPPSVLQVPLTYERTKYALSALNYASERMELVKTSDAPKVKAKIGQGITVVKNALAVFKEMGYDEATEAQLPGFYEETSPVITSDFMESAEYANLANAATQLSDFYDEAQKLLGTDEGVLSPKDRAKTTVKESIRTTEGAHLFNQLIFPETFFVSPPCCNVIFPDQYFQFSFSRNFMREITRLNLQAGVGFLVSGGSSGGAAALLSHAYYAPNIKDVRKTTMYMSMSKGSTILLPHELHSGIIPKFEWVSDGHRWAAKGAKSSGQTDDFYDNGKVGFLQRLSNFQFFLHRWSSRSLSVSGIFNPNVVLGLPGVVMDRSLPGPEVVKDIEKKIGRKWLPIQYLGKVAYVSHSIHQQGGGTQVSFTHCRMHRGFDDEFLGVLVRDNKKIVAKSVTLKFQVKPLFNVFLQSKGNGVELTGKGADKIPALSTDDLKKIVALYLDDGVKADHFLSAPTSLRGAKVLKITATGSFTVSGRDLKDIGLAAVEEEGNVVPETLELQLEFKVGTGEIERSTTSIEAALTPSWYSDIWINKNIGKKVYQPLLGIGAITDFLGLKASKQSGLLDQTFLSEATEASKKLTAVDPAPGADPFSLFEDPTGIDNSVFNSNPGSIEEAIDSLTILYGLMRQKGADLHEFIKAYSKRPIANLEQVLGSANLAFDANGDIDPNIQGRVIEGFHSRAFGDYNADVRFETKEGDKPQAGKDAMVGLFPGVPDSNSVKRKKLINDGSPPSSIPKFYDPRGRARGRIQAYIQELQVSRGLVG